MNSNAYLRDIAEVHLGIFNFGHLRRIDGLFVLFVSLLMGMGLLCLYSASMTIDTEGSLMTKQCAAIIIGMFLALTIICMDLRFVISFAPVMYAIMLLMLIVVLMPGLAHKAKGGQRWIPLGPIHIQPSEMAKLVVIYMLAWYLNTVKKRIRKLPYFLLAFIISGIPAVLIFKQPNLGTAMVMMPITLAMLYMAGARILHFVILFLVMVLVGLMAAPVVWNHLKDYQKERIMNFIDPGPNPAQKSWQTVQSKITLGSGGMAGKGFCKGPQTYLKYLPEHHTDFIFSHLGEEWGFIGTASVVCLFIALFLRGLYFARDCPEFAGVLLATGVVTLLAFHVFINIAITLGLMPVTGIPLPFLSYGPSFYITTMMSLGVLLNVPIKTGIFDK